MQALGSNGHYQTIACPAYVYDYPMDGLFGCVLDRADLIANNFSLDHIRIREKNGSYVYTVTGMEDFHPMIIEDPLITV